MIAVGDTIYFISRADDEYGNYLTEQLLAYDTSNDSTWLVTEIGNGGWDNGVTDTLAVLGDTFYFRGKDVGGVYELWAHDTSNCQTWNGISTSGGSSLWNYFDGTTLYYHWDDGTSDAIHAHQPAEIDNSTTTGCFMDGQTPGINPSEELQLAIVELASYEYTTCAITGNGSVACWGENFSNNFGGVHPDFDTPQPIPLPSGRTAVDISVGKHSACAILDNASVVCWGKGKNGHLGNNATYADAQNQAGDYYYNPVYTEPMPDGATPLALASAESSHCALLDNGKVACWGANGDGQLGIGQSYVVKPYPLLTDPFPEGQKAIMLSGSHDHYCVLMENLDVSCWGGQTLSEFTLGWLDEQGSPIDYNDATSPILGAAFNLGGLSNGKQGQSIRYVDVGFSGTCVILTNYSIACSAHISGTSTPWNGEAEHPFLVSNPTGQRPITLSGNCALLENLSIACWRHTTGDFQNHVNVTAPYTLTYSNMSEFGDIAALQKGYASHLCAITTSAQMVCAGDNRYGQLGQGSSGGSSGAGYVGGNWSFGPIFGGGSGGSGPARMLVTNATCSITPALPTGLSLTQGTCAITGTPFLGMANTTFTVTAVIENVTYAGEFWLNITGPLDPPMPLIAVNNTAIIDYGPYSALDGATYEISPDLPGDLVLNPTTGVISGTPRETLANTTFTIWANSSSENRTWNFTLEILEDTDGDGDPDQLPDDYDPGVSAPPMLTEDLDDDGDGISDLEEDADGTDPLNPDTDGDGMCDGAIAVDPHCFAGPDAFPTDPAGDTDTDGDGKPDTLNPPSNSVPPLEEDMDDDGDGVEDVNETDTGIYVDETDTGTNPLNPDTDYDGTCDGPVDVYHPQTGDLICVAGPDTELGNLAYGTHYGLNGSAIQSIRPEWRPAGAVWTISPDLPADLTIDPVSGLISGIPSEVTGNVTYTISGVGTSSTYSSQFNLQILEDTDRDGEANELPADYDNTTVTPMVEDLDDDGDGLSDLVETGTGLYNGTGDYGTDPLNPDTDGDGVCDGPNSVWPICINGPDSNPFGTHDASNIVLVENMAITTPIPPPNQVPGAVWEISPALPEGLTLNTSSGIITGTPTEVRDNETYTLWANVSDFGRSDSVALSVMATFGLTVLADTDGDGMPDELPDDYDENIGILVEDDDDDNDGMLDTEEATEGTNPLDPDTDGDGFCDGPADVYSSSGELICRGPDPAPLDANEPLDTDGDMFPDEDPDGEGGLVADADDDNDGFLDTLETSCGSSTVDATDTPQDYDGDTICDLMDPDMDGDGLNNTIETDTGIYIDSDNTGTNALNPDTDGDGYCDGPVSPNYSNCTAGPDAFPTDASAHLDTDGDGNPDTITGNSTTGLIEDLDDDGDGASDIAELDCGTDPLDATDVAETDSDGNCLKKIADPESLFEWNWGWCFCLVFLLLLLLLIPIVMQRDRILLMLADGPEPENTTSLPEFVSGAGTIDDPFILAPAEGIKPGESVSSTEVITIDKMSDIRVDMIDLNQEDNGNKFAMYETSFDEIGVRLVAVGSDGQITINFIFDDGEGEESYAGGEFTGLMKLGRASVYFSWTVTVTPDKAKMREIEKAEKEAKKAEEKAAKEAKKAEEKAAKEAEALAKKEAKEAEAAAKKAEEEAAALLAEEEAAAAAALAAKEEEEKAAKEAEAKAKKEAEAEAAALLAEEEAAAKKKAEEEAAAAALAAKEEEEKAAKEAEALAKEEAEAAAKKKAEEEASAAAAAAAAKPANKEEKKKAELKRVKERSKSIDFKVLGKAKASEKDDLQVIKGVGPFIEEKLNALGIYTYKQISKMTSKLEDTVNEAIEFFPGRVKRDQWVAQAKILLGEDVKLDEKALKQAEELARVAAKAESIDFATIGVASASEKDDLQTLKGIGPFIEEKLNALGIFKFEQIAKMTSEIEEEVNIAIEFFPGRVKRDEWVKQAKKLSKK
ncbi:MAG: putative Ig domain-containing protein [Candidatus Poseidoniaceae archaeon]